MSKTKRIKQKTTGFDIVYRVVTAVIAVAMYPMFYFANLFTIEIRHTQISDLINKLNGGDTLHVTHESFSLATMSKWIEALSKFTNDSFDFKTNILQNSTFTPIVVAVVFVAIALVIGLVIIGFAAFSNKTKVVIGLSAAGFLCTVASNISFGIFAKPIISGDVTLAKLFDIDGIIASQIISLLGEVSIFTLDTAFYAVMFSMLAILIWSASVLVVNKSEEKEKAMKEAARKNR